jgi:hypothetical protein
MKDQLMALVVSDYKLCEGNVDQIKTNVCELQLHNFHSLVSENSAGLLPVSCYSVLTVQ